MYKYVINLNSTKDILNFTDKVNTVAEDVRLFGKDENGRDWEISAKSFLCSLVMATKLQNRKQTAHEVDWNTLVCSCEKDIYSLIREYVK